MKYASIRTLLMTGFCGLAFSLVASSKSAAGDTYNQSAELGKRTAKMSEDVDKYVGQLDKTEQALVSVNQAQGQDLKKRYAFFAKEVNSFEEAQKHLRDLKAFMKTDLSAGNVRQGRRNDSEILGRRRSLERQNRWRAGHAEAVLE